MAKANHYSRYCPGEEHIQISDAVCLGRRRANFTKCPGCQFNDDERATRPFEAEVLSRATPDLVAQRNEVAMISSVFKAYDVRATYPEPLNEEVAWRVGNGAAQFLRTSMNLGDRSDLEMGKLIVGRDMRKSSPALTRAFCEGVVATGTPVIDIGMIDTAQIYFATNHFKCCGGVMVTASHNPANYNGFKICGPKGKPIGRDSGLQEVERIATAIARHKVEIGGRITQQDLSEPYHAFVRGFLREPRKLKIVVDGSNGMAGRWFPILFGDVKQFDVTTLNMTHDGDFKHDPNPLVEANLAELKAAVKSRGADLGACFDGDADRCIFVDENGATIPCDLLTALLARDYLAAKPGSAVIYDLRSSRIVPETVTENGGVPKRGRVGHVFMKRMMAEYDGVFGGELSGHFYFRDNFYCDSGVLTFVAVVNAMSAHNATLSELIAPFRKYPSSGERNFKTDDKDAVLRAIQDRYKDAKIDHLDGVTVEYGDWWFNLRASNTEPLLRLNVEADNEKLLENKLAELTPMLGAPVDH
ncbi:MAG: phosphomannomutase/phosphoglucomutase [Phycisphaerales bacterium]|nr:phosphomannomutase/phosphoglucomutase [Phycisphaerales bacterium]